MMCCRETKIVLLCLLVHACVILKVVWAGWATPDGLEVLQLLFIVVPIGAGFILSFTCIHQQGIVDKLVGLAGLAWFGILFVWELFVNFIV